LRMNDPLLAAPHGRRWAMSWCSERAVYGGSGVAGLEPASMWTLQANCAWLFRAEPHPR